MQQNLRFTANQSRVRSEEQLGRVPRHDGLQRALECARPRRTGVETERHVARERRDAPPPHGPKSLAELHLGSGMKVAHMEVSSASDPTMGGITMLWTIFLILLVLWALGLVTSYTMGGFIHVLLVIAIIVVIIQLLQGRRVT